MLLNVVRAILNILKFPTNSSLSVVAIPDKMFSIAVSIKFKYVYTATIYRIFDNQC